LLYPEHATHVALKTDVLLVDFETGLTAIRYSGVENLPLDMTAVTVDLVPDSISEEKMVLFSGLFLTNSFRKLTTSSIL